GCWGYGRAVDFPCCVLRIAYQGQNLAVQVGFVFPGEHNQRGFGSIMARELAGTFQNLRRGTSADSQFARDSQQRLFVDHAWPEDAGRSDRNIEYRGLDAYLRLTSVHNQRNFVAEAL